MQNSGSAAGMGDSVSEVRWSSADKRMLQVEEAVICTNPTYMSMGGHED